MNAVIFLAILFIIGLVMFYRGFSTLQKKRKIEHTPTSKIRSISLGEVEIYGKALPASNSNIKGIIACDEREEFIGPLTGKKCVYCITVVEELQQRGKHHHWVRVAGDSYLRPFYIKDDTGRVLVNPKGAQINVPVDFKEESGFGRDPSIKVQEYLKSKNLSFEGFFGMNKKMRYTESTIAVNNDVYVFGDAMPSGKMSSVGCENILINKKNKSSLFYISDRPEKDAVKFFGRMVLIEIYGGAALSIASLAFFIAAMGG